MRLFADNNVAPRFIEALERLVRPVDGIVLTHLQSKFPRSCNDVDWLRALGNEGGWVILSGDMRITRNRAELAVWRETGLPAFFIDEGWMRRQFWAQFLELVRWWPGIVRLGRSAQPQAAWKLCAGRVEPKVIDTSPR